MSGNSSSHRNGNLIELLALISGKDQSHPKPNLRAIRVWPHDRWLDGRLAQGENTGFTRQGSLV